MKKEFSEIIPEKIALLIDADNAQPTLIEKTLNETGKYGLITIRRIYGDWTAENMRGWKRILNNYAIQPIQQFRYTVGKNSTDSAMIIDAMDVLHSHRVDGFCIVSSDSDYTRLATRIREAGIFVMGVGKRTTPKPFVNACNVFIYTENLVSKEDTEKTKKASISSSAEHGKTKKYDPVPMLKAATEMAAQEDGWANLATIGFYLHQLDPGFDPRTYGYKQLSQLIKKYFNVFELRHQDENGPTSVYVKLKE